MPDRAASTPMRPFPRPRRPLRLAAAVLILPFLAPLAPRSAPAKEMAPGPTWKLSDENSTVYLTGSVHLLREEDMPIPDAFDRLYRKADELVFEIDMKSMFDPTMVMKIRRLGSLPDDESLGDHLDEDTVEDLRAYLAERGMRKTLFDGFTPGMVYLTLGSLEASRHGALPNLGLEAQLYQRAQKDEKPSRGLETAQYQISRFDELETDTVEALIQEMLDDVDSSEETLDSIIEAWKTGDVDELSGSVLDKLDAHSEARHVLLTERNRNWIPEIEKALAGRDTVLFVVGAAHLVGEHSVIDMLEKAGHRPVQIETIE